MPEQRQSDRPAASGITSSASAAAVHLPAPMEGFVWVFDPDTNDPMMVPAKSQAALEAKHSLLTTPYDVEASSRDWLASHQAVADTVTQSLEEFARDHVVRDETFTAISMAFGAWTDAARRLMRDIGGTLPREQQMQDMAAVKQRDGNLRGYPLWQRHEPLIDAYLEAQNGGQPTPPPQPPTTQE